MKLGKGLLFLFLLWVLLPAWCRADTRTWEPEEPDYAFLAGSPYTENKQFLQVILTNLFQNFRTTAVRTGEVPQRQLNNLLRFEYGFTDRLEADLVMQFVSSWTDAGIVSPTNQQFNGFGDSLLGLRYRFLTEKKTPITLTFGPQLFLPTGNVQEDFGTGGLGLAWDLTMAREWNRLFFTYLQLNYSTIFHAVDTTPGSLDSFTLNNFFWAVAFGFRPIERDGAKGDHHCLHVTLEAGGVVGQQVESGMVMGARVPLDTFVIVPGLRYGYLTKNKTLTEIGMAAVMGFGQDSPTWGLILQTQFEYGFIKKE